MLVITVLLLVAFLTVSALRDDHVEPSDLQRSSAPPVSRQPPCIHVIAFDRAHSLDRLLRQLNRMDYGEDSGRVRMTIAVDRPGRGARPERVQRQRETVAVAEQFEFQHGPKVVQQRLVNSGIVIQWVDSWQPDLDPEDDRRACWLLEDDLVPSTHAWKWVNGALDAYADSTDRIASFGLQRPTLVPAPDHTGLMGKMPPDAPGPFLYRQMGSWGFIALREPWIMFRKWMRHEYEPGQHRMDLRFEGNALLPSEWHKRSPDSIWTYWFVMFAGDHDLFTLYSNMDNHKALCANMQEPGLHYSDGRPPAPDTPVLEEDVPALHSFPPLTELTWYKWNAMPMASQPKLWLHAEGAA